MDAQVGSGRRLGGTERQPFERTTRGARPGFPARARGLFSAPSTTVLRTGPPPVRTAGGSARHGENHNPEEHGSGEHDPGEGLGRARERAPEKGSAADATPWRSILDRTDRPHRSSAAPAAGSTAPLDHGSTAAISHPHTAEPARWGESGPSSDAANIRRTSTDPTKPIKRTPTRSSPRICTTDLHDS